MSMWNNFLLFSLLKSGRDGRRGGWCFYREGGYLFFRDVEEGGVGKIGLIF